MLFISFLHSVCLSILSLLHSVSLTLSWALVHFSACCHVNKSKDVNILYFLTVSVNNPRSVLKKQTEGYGSICISLFVIAPSLSVSLSVSLSFSLSSCLTSPCLSSSFVSSHVSLSLSHSCSHSLSHSPRLTLRNITDAAFALLLRPVLLLFVWRILKKCFCCWVFVCF